MTGNDALTAASPDAWQCTGRSFKVTAGGGLSVAILSSLARWRGTGAESARAQLQFESGGVLRQC